MVSSHSSDALRSDAHPSMVMHGAFGSKVICKASTKRERERENMKMRRC